jgi:hypothetical protein
MIRVSMKASDSGAEWGVESNLSTKRGVQEA